MRSYATLNIVRVLKGRWMRWAGYVTRMGEIRNLDIWPENLKGRDHSVVLGVDGKITLE
jgi:hypothetical protein